MTLREGVKLHLVEPFTRRHHGLLTMQAVLESGQSKRTWYRANDSGLLVPVYPGVSRVVSSPTSRLQAIHAAVLAMGDGAVASHRTGLELWGVPDLQFDGVDVMLTRRRHPVVPDGIVVHRPRDLIDIAPVWRHGIPASKLLRGLTDLGAVAPDRVHAAVGHVLTERLASGAALYWATRAHSRQGRHGVVALRDALHEWLVDGKVLDSDLEREMNKARRRHKLPPMTFHAICAGYEVDWLVDGTMVVVECDSLEYHDKRREDFERDRKKKADLAAAGYRVVPITWRQLTRQSKWMAAVVRSAITADTATAV
ncbi:hypothetical protein [Desertimonas flava]|uniref:hypothetical protein n=1 Tax=Desertimonas flava TaxID=2064846 RepID=UPI000E3482E2|nr:hypothetical protein [Desertimonas flava]